MARYCVLWRLCFGWCLLLCFLSPVEAATKSVKVPSIADQVEKGLPSLAGDVLTMNTAIEGEFIPAPTKNVPVRGILGGTEFGLNTIKSGTKSLLKGGLQGLVITAALEALLKGVGWVMEDGAVVKKAPASDEPVPTQPGNYRWGNGDGATYTASSALEGCKITAARIFPPRGTPTLLSIDASGAASCQWVDPNNPNNVQGFTSYRIGDGCPVKSVYSSQVGGCISSETRNQPLTDTDFIDMDTWISNQDAPYLQNLLKQQCVGSLNPNACYTGLRKAQLDLRGPKSVDAGTTTTSTTHAKSDGTTSITTTTTNNKYDIVYGPNNFTYTRNSTATTTTDGKPGDTTTTTEEPTDEADPDDTDDVTPSPCSGVGCDGPKYEKLYEPTKDTKEKALDSYASRVKSLPIIASVAGFFTVNASAGCPSWSTNVSFAVFASMFSYDLVFDFYCQPWFVSMAQYAKIVFSIVCAYLAFRQAILD